jgi:hypothetical protein
MFTTLLVHFFGSQIPVGSKIVTGAFAFRHGSWLGWMLLLAVLLCVATAWAYARADEQLSRGRRWTMAGLRMALICLILLLLVQPVLRLVVEGQIRRSMLFMLDSSQSMTIADPRTSSDDIKRAMIAEGLLDPTLGLNQPADLSKRASRDDPTRVKLLEAVLRNPRLDLLNKLAKDYDLRPFGFAQTLTDLTPPDAQPGSETDKYPWAGRLTATGTSTPLGDDLRELLSRTRGQPVAGIFLATDGQSNAGGSPLAAAQQAGADGVPLFIYGVGLANPKDIIVSSVYAPDIAFVRDEVPVTVRVRGAGLVGQTGHVVLKLGSDTVDEKDVTFDGSEQAVTMKFTPGMAGNFNVSASIAPRADEAVKENNSASTSIKVIDGKIKVLFVDSSPRWEFKYLQAMLLRDRRVDVKCLLQDADESLSEDANSPYLRAFPQTKAELFDHYDMVILGDVDPAEFSAQQLDNLGEFVSKFGGGLLVVPGRQFGVARLAASPLAKLLPVDLKNAEPAGGAKQIQLALTPAGERSTMLRLSDDEEESKALWAKLPPIYWDIPAKAKPAAEVLLTDPTAIADDTNRRAVLAVQQYGLGPVMYFGTDNTWRWRKNVGDRYYVAIWGQIIQRLALPHLLGESKRTQLSSDKKSYAAGDRVTLFARLYDQGFVPLTDPVASGAYVVGDHTAPLELRALPDEPGMYRGEFIAPSPGNYSFHMDRDEKTTLNFAVTEAKLEFTQTAMNEPLLRQMAAASGGAFYREEDLCKLPDAVRLKSETVRSTIELELWSTPLILGLMIAVATAEWILRKLSQLK